MVVRLTKPWRPLDETEVEKLTGHLGVYEIADAEGRILHIGFAGGRSLFGLRQLLGEELSARGSVGYQFRCEINMQYTTRQRELLMTHRADHGALPPEDLAMAERIGRLSPG